MQYLSIIKDNCVIYVFNSDEVKYIGRYCFEAELCKTNAEDDSIQRSNLAALRADGTIFGFGESDKSFSILAPIKVITL